MSYKMTFGRKFFSGLVGIVVLLYLYTITLFNNPVAITGQVLVTFAVLVVTIVFAYIGGNIWNNWIKSKHFNMDLFNGGR